MDRARYRAYLGLFFTPDASYVNGEEGKAGRFSYEEAEAPARTSASPPELVRADHQPREQLADTTPNSRIDLDVERRTNQHHQKTCFELFHWE